MKYFDDLSTKKKRIVGIIGITVVLGSWALVPSLAALIGYSSLDIAFWLTFFYAVVWVTHRQLKKKGKKKSS